MSGRRTEYHQYYMDFAPLLLYMVAMIVKHARCQAMCSPEAIREVDELLKNLPMEMYDCRLYTPTLNDYRNCSKSMLRCFEKETTVLIAETQKKLQHKLLRMLKNLGLKLKDKKPRCPVCELYKEEEPETFLKTLLDILTMMNTFNNCSG